MPSLVQTKENSGPEDQLTTTQFEHELVYLFWLAATSQDMHFLK